MVEKLKISIVVPVYNAEVYIKKCINSIMKQSYSNIEILAIDDGSKDKSLEILNQLAESDSRLKVISQKNAGPSKARNRGVELSTGELIAFVDADDYLDTTYLEKMVYGIKDSDLIVCNYIEENHRGSIKANIYNCITKEKSKIDENIIDEIVSRMGGLVWGKLFRKDIIDKYKISFDENFKMSEDLLFVLEFVNKAQYIGKVNDYLYFHNKNNDESITCNYSSDLFYKQIELQKKISSILLKTIGAKKSKMMINTRMKDIVMYSINKETISEKNYRNKINTIRGFITTKEVVEECKEFKKNGHIDRMLVNAILNKNVRMVYWLTRTRSIALDIYYKVKK